MSGARLAALDAEDYRTQRMYRGCMVKLESDQRDNGRRGSSRRHPVPDARRNVHVQKISHPPNTMELANMLAWELAKHWIDGTGMRPKETAMEVNFDCIRMVLLRLSAGLPVDYHGETGFHCYLMREARLLNGENRYNANSSVAEVEPTGLTALGKYYAALAQDPVRWANEAVPDMEVFMKMGAAVAQREGAQWRQ